MKFFTLQDVKDPRLAQCMLIYRSSFPDNERQREAVIIDRISGGSAELYAGEDNEQIQCIALVWIFDNSRFALLDYFAVTDRMRGKGVGSAFMQFILQRVKAVGKSLVMEVEHPEYGNNMEERKARINFYRRNGAAVLEDVRYFLPPLGTATEPLEMQLMIAFADETRPTAAEIRQLIVRIYADVYNRASDDLVLNSFLD